MIPLSAGHRYFNEQKYKQKVFDIKQSTTQWLKGRMQGEFYWNSVLCFSNDWIIQTISNKQSASDVAYWWSSDIQRWSLRCFGHHHSSSQSKVTTSHQMTRLSPSLVSSASDLQRLDCYTTVLITWSPSPDSAFSPHWPHHTRGEWSTVHWSWFNSSLLP